ncbi:UNVERIFIED_CONTAM: Retrovirus-related Pol polyprotein from transposon RE1 [Sesamum calycinum]|uniref:Retrovirus-related Pol polyprotein from transposon RE1 n=1 Tax=Sesamum calycinum TaxID=2727403 RepID=A0AAW2NIY1_9LAMI
MPVIIAELEVYRQLIGRLIYLGYSRLDISHAFEQLSRFLQSPCQQHWDATIQRALLSRRQYTLFKAYRDADWAASEDSRHSLTGYCTFFGSTLISWKTKKQSTVSRSTTEAKYRSMGTTACELTWIFNLLKDLQVHVTIPIPFLCDNQAALHITTNLVFHLQLKHLKIDCHLVLDKYKSGFLAPSHVPSKAQLVDVFTKTLIDSHFLSLVSKLGLVNLLPSPT